MAAAKSSSGPQTAGETPNQALERDESKEERKEQSTADIAVLTLLARRFRRLSSPSRRRRTFGHIEVMVCRQYHRRAVRSPSAAQIS
jgi:hypothetical protein